MSNLRCAEPGSSSSTRLLEFVPAFKEEQQVGVNHRDAARAQAQGRHLQVYAHH